MEITYTSHNFPKNYGSQFIGENKLQFTIHELMWAAITVGRANKIDIFRHGIYSEFEILYRTSIIIANIAQKSTTLEKSSAYESLDPSEKSAVSYFLGLTFTKLMAQKLLKITWLLHIDVYQDHFTNQGQAFGFGPSKKRPDLIGLNNKREWIVVESKGRTNQMDSKLLGKAKNQTRNLRNIGGVFPILRVAVVTHFINRKLVVDWEDPEGYNDIFFDLDTNIEDYLSNYYKLIFDILSNNDTIEVEGYKIYTFTAINLTIGLNIQIYNSYSIKDLKAIEPFQEITLDNLGSIQNQTFFVGSDGILIGLGSNWEQLIRTN